MRTLQDSHFSFAMKELQLAVDVRIMYFDVHCNIVAIAVQQTLAELIKLR